MGCHTHYEKLVTKNQEEIIKKIKDVISVSESYNWYEFITMENLFHNNEEWLEEIADYVYDSINGLIEVDGVFSIYESTNRFNINEPRIGGFPDTIIKSSDEMFKAMKTGLVGFEGKIFNFSWDEEDDNYIRKNIIDFFKTHPDGIIRFG
jgi:hypothetical protein